MNRIHSLFKNKQERVLSIYFTAGFPKLEDTLSIMEAIQAGGADIIEIGVPYSDPIADGPTIQDSNQIALENGMSLKKLFQQLEGFRSKIELPVVLMGYLNPIIQYGMEAFCKKCQEVGIDGLILPDLPMQQYLDEFKSVFEQYGLVNTFLISPQTSEKRILEIDQNTDGFIYMVSSHSITGAKSGISEEQISYFKRVQEMGLKNPRLIGFGISDAETFSTASKYSHGAIIGSAFIKTVKDSKNLNQDIQAYLQSVLN
ncbi:MULTISPECIES: tryptophan synthase subunit alpha [Algoriphagus]|jgi:tryptophan synthase alpha chain|uniref:tryptophan synthase subunit alpha n=3 Tax=Cyclobacteriaceae TaxID=563798 RepID=UPI000C549647|nr:MULTISPECIES: tryptophan synthase subunit alpha [Algoriphagus]MAL12545.1 tryptophan synthase subunit alpha [Algoriphagus sp.]MAN88152.1 tryptophan synthase subunit alpha [Algoriphagus sp.]QYH37487.1 tryptophan synthase subunit alpha [Algoriphagus sp. NBT04N3]HAH36648.1 tryptophan synthase subunit alpha [Algoriphagus sp.]HAS57024.1 tryptophan synthase subunit alpha [Algoriphagus sp.]|tara:strand:- start:7536 stop:8309 length:774 start_codon:yes stop_codon:yes gene_type:complete